jgi:Cu2+-exporting ATPase
LQIVQQNLRWALIYNLAAVPIAALGFMPPWVAAIGMSASSLLVVMNARRAGTSPTAGVAP